MRKLNAMVKERHPEGFGIPMARQDLLIPNVPNTSAVWSPHQSEPSYLRRPQTAGAMLSSLGNKPEINENFMKQRAKKPKKTTDKKVLPPKKPEAKSQQGRSAPSRGQRFSGINQSKQTYLDQMERFGRKETANVFKGQSAEGLYSFHFPRTPYMSQLDAEEFGNPSGNVVDKGGKFTPRETEVERRERLEKIHTERKADKRNMRNRTERQAADDVRQEAFDDVVLEDNRIRFRGHGLSRQQWREERRDMENLRREGEPVSQREEYEGIVGTGVAERRVPEDEFIASQDRRREYRREGLEARDGRPNLFTDSHFMTGVSVAQEQLDRGEAVMTTTRIQREFFPSTTQAAREPVNASVPETSIPRATFNTGSVITEHHQGGRQGERDTLKEYRKSSSITFAREPLRMAETVLPDDPSYDTDDGIEFEDNFRSNYDEDDPDEGREDEDADDSGGEDDGYLGNFSSAFAASDDDLPPSDDEEINMY